MCGISGVVGYGNIVKTLLESIRNLEYRGYDSCGVAVMSSNGIEVRKNAGTVDSVVEKEHLHQLKGQMGIAHTRWATHGGVTKENAHPHLSTSGRFAIVHNGIISNYKPLRDELEEGGYRFRSQTDTEVIVNLIDKYYDETGDTEEAIRRCMRRLEGTYAFAMITAVDKDKIFCAKMESPLIIGMGNEANYVGSDFNSFINYTKNALIMDDGEYAILTRSDVVVKDIDTGEVKGKKITKIEWDMEVSKKGGYPHYMLKEIHEQPQTVANALNIGAEEMRGLASMAHNTDKIYLIGAGTTYYVCLMAQYYFSSIAKRFIPVLTADEFTNLAHVNRDTLILTASQSGETYDILNALRFAKKRGARTGAVVNVVGSSVARLVDHAVMQGAGPEICVVSTKAALSQMVIFLRVVKELALMEKTITAKEADDMDRALMKLSEDISTILNEKSGIIHTIAQRYCNIKNWIYLGRGLYYPIVMEAALKMKEVTYLHAEGMPGGFLKHGTLAMIDNTLATLIFLPSMEDKEIYDLTMSSAEEVRARNGFLIGIRFETADVPKKLFSEEIVLPDVNKLTAPLSQLITGQLFAYFTATALKRDVDKPRSLAKSVTVA